MSKPMVSKQVVEQCIRELKAHDLVKEGWGADTYAITEKAECLIIKAMRVMRQNYPNASAQDVKYRALITVVLQQMGNVIRKYMPIYVSILDGLTEHMAKQ